MEDKLKLLAEVLTDNSLTKVSYEDSEIKIVLEKEPARVSAVYSTAGAPPAATTAAAPAEAALTPAAPEVEGEEVLSPLAGIYYSRPSPESGTFVKEGSKVKAGETMCIVESMKIMNEIKAPYDLTVLKMLKKDEEVAEFNEPLFMVKR